MEQLVYIMAILGCGDNDAQCDPVRTMPAIYATAEARDAATSGALGQNTDVAYPVVMAKCRAADAKLAQRLTGQALASR